MKLFLLATAFASPTLLLPLDASALDDRFEAKAGSSVNFTKVEDGAVAVRVQNTRFVPYFFMEELGGRHYRLLTIATDVTLRTDRAQVDDASFVSVTVDDMGDTPSERISFKDPGEDGAVVAQRYFATTRRGSCCDGDMHHVRLLETGKYLFRSSGPGSVGITAWAEFTGSRPFQIRWAAFAGVSDAAQYADGVLGTLTYGGHDGLISAVLVARPRKLVDYDDLIMALEKGARLLWVDNKEKLSEEEIASYYQDPSSGTPDNPRVVWPLDMKKADPANVPGLELALELHGKRLISIPVEGDKLVVDKAIVDPELVLKPAP